MGTVNEGKKIILVVEDEMIIGMNLRRILMQLGHKVPEVVTSGEEAIAQALALRPDLVLMDIHLSDAMDGIDAATVIVQELDIPIVYITAYADEETLKRASLTAPFGYILKPFETREIQANIEVAFYKSQIDKRIKENRQWLLAVLNSMCEGVAASDTEGLIKFLNPVAEALTGWSQTEAVGQPATEVLQFIDEVTRRLIENPLLRALQEDKEITLQDHALLLTREGQETPVMDGATLIRTDKGEKQGAVMVFQDVTEQRRIYAQLEHDALHDPLTQLPNRIQFLNRLEQSIERARRSPDYGFAVMLLDLNRFKNINDTLGHLIGDQTLIAVAPRLRSHLRTVDIVARFGGDEFAILLEDVDSPEIASSTAERILEELKQPFYIGDHELFITASVGIVLSSEPYQQATNLLQKADIAMYRAKKRQGGYEMFDVVTHYSAQDGMKREHALRRAVAQAEFRVYYQPIIALADQTVSGMEALVRWQPPEGGLIYPDRFIRQAEEMGLITTIDHWVLQEACQQLVTWQTLELGIWVAADGQLIQQAHGAAAPPPIAININLSSRHFTNSNLLATIATILETTGLSSHHLKLEITESAFIDNTHEAANLLAQLKQLNVQICLDDFGTGYSSFSYLHQIPIDSLKIDRSFVEGIDTNSQKREIVRAIISMGHALGMTLAAEGIETRAQADLLRDMGCEYGQGYFFSHPIDGDTAFNGMQ